MTTYSQMGDLFESGKLPGPLDDLYKYSATSGATSPSVVTNPSILSRTVEAITKGAVSDPFAWFTQGSLSALKAAEAAVSHVYQIGDQFIDAISGEVRDAKGNIVKAKGSYANLAKTAALLGAIGGGGAYLFDKKEELDERKPKSSVAAKRKPKKKGKSGKNPRRL